MKKIVICASVVGLATGAIYWFNKKKKSNTASFEPVDKKANSETNVQNEDISPNSDLVEELCYDKRDSSQAIYERHSESASIMKEAYLNVMEDFVEEFQNENDARTYDVNIADAVDNKSISVMKDIESLSDELDDLLK